MNPEIFREYDIRGHAENDLDNETVELIGKAYAAKMIEKNAGRVMLGCDNRESSERIKSKFAEALKESGLKVMDIGIVPIPALYYSIVAMDADGGVMVTGSHLGKEFNGFKLSADKNAATLSGEEIQEIRKKAEMKEFVEGLGEIKSVEILEKYIVNIVKRVRLEKPVKVVIDCGNGTSSLVAEKILRALGCEVSALYCTLDSSFPNHHPDPVKPENLQDLIAKVRAEKADLGIAFDGDSDRLGVIDDKGNILWGDSLLSLLAVEVIEKNPGAKIVCEVKCSNVVRETVEKAGGEFIMYKTGHSLIKKKMKETGALLAGEMSGHMFFADNYFGFDDALFAAARVCQLVAKKGRLSKLAESLPQYYSTPEIRVSVSESEKWEISEKARKYFTEKYDTLTIDGVRVNFKDGWALIRASNTSPKLVLRMESKSREGLERIKELMRKAMKSFSGGLKLDF